MPNLDSDNPLEPIQQQAERHAVMRERLGEMGGQIQTEREDHTTPTLTLPGFYFDAASKRNYVASPLYRLHEDISAMVVEYLRADQVSLLCFLRMRQDN